MFALRHAAALAGALAATLPALPAPAEDGRVVSGRATYLARIALPPGADLVAEARGHAGESLALVRRPTGGAQVPLPFSLTLPPGITATLRVAIFDGGLALWVGDAVPVLPDGPGPGEILLRPYIPFGLSDALLCGDRRLRIAFASGAALLDTGAGVIALHAVPAASGIDYLSADGLTRIRGKGAETTVSIGGSAPAPCQPVPPEVPQRWTARGMDSGWALTVEGGRATFTSPGGEPLSAPLPDAEITDGALRYRFPDAGMTVTLAETLCRHGRSGLPGPQTVTVETAAGRLSGCGGDPAALLAGPEWVVEDIAGRGIIDNSHLTLLFAEGRVAGSAGCNRYTGPAGLGGGRLTFGPAAATMMACPEALMEQERRFFETLAAVDGFDIDATGALLLTAGGRPLLTARR